MRLIIFGLALAVGALAQTAVVRTAAGDPTITSVIANAGTTGTTVSRLAKVNASGQAIITATTDTSGAVGVVIGGAGTTGSATIATLGGATCEADNTMTTGDFVVLGSTTAGRCRSAGTSCPVSGQVIGQARTSAAAAATFTVQLRAGLCPNSGGQSLTAADTHFAPFGPPLGGVIDPGAISLTVRYYGFANPFSTLKVTKIRVIGYTDQASRVFTFGIYDSACALIAQTDTVDMPAAGAAATVTFASPPSLTSSYYYLAYTTECTTCVLTHMNNSDSYYGIMLVDPTTPLSFTGATAATQPGGSGTAITLPATCGTPRTATTANARNPVIAVFFN